MRSFLIFLFLIPLLACKNITYQDIPTMKKDTTTTEEQWQQTLSPEQYYVLRQKGTERPFTGEYNDFYQDGSYHCAACDQKLFDSTTKFDGHCGWPSFDKAIKGSVEYIKDISHGMIRTEVICSNCHGHLGHVFPDGPQETTGERYCMNSISLKFVEEK